MADQSGLTKEEHRILWLLSLGYTRSSVAQMSGVSDSDLARKLTPLYDFYGVRNTTALVAKTLVFGHLVLTKEQAAKGMVER